MTAAHCFCRNGDGSGITCKTVQREGKPTSQPDYDVSSVVNIVVGVNNMKITEAMKDRNSVHTPTEVEQVTTDTLNFTQGPKIPRRLFHKMCIFKKKKTLDGFFANTYFKWNSLLEFR